MKNILIICIFYCVLSPILAQRKLVCYWNMESNSNPKNGAFSYTRVTSPLCTHIIYNYIFYMPTPPSVTLIKEASDDVIKSSITHFRNTIPNVKLLIGVGGPGWGTTWPSNISATTERNVMATKINDFITEFNFDGCDLNWQYPTEGDKTNFGYLLMAMKDKIVGKILSVSVATKPEDIITSYDFNQLSFSADIINLNIYNLRGRYDVTKTGLHSPYRKASRDVGNEAQWNVESIVTNWKNIIHVAFHNKLTLGIATFGRSFELADVNNYGIDAQANGIGKSGEWVRSINNAGVVPFSEICLNLKINDAWNSFWDVESFAPYAVHDNQWISYDDQDTVAAKLHLAANQNLGGVNFESIEYDDFSNICGYGAFPLLSMTYDAIVKDEFPPNPLIPIETTSTERPGVTTTITTTSTATNPVTTSFSKNVTETTTTSDDETSTTSEPDLVTFPTTPATTISTTTPATTVSTTPPATTPNIETPSTGNNTKSHSTTTEPTSIPDETTTTESSNEPTITQTDYSTKTPATGTGISITTTSSIETSLNPDNDETTISVDDDSTITQTEYSTKTPATGTGILFTTTSSIDVTSDDDDTTISVSVDSTVTQTEYSTKTPATATTSNDQAITTSFDETTPSESEENPSTSTDSNEVSDNTTILTEPTEEPSEEDTTKGDSNEETTASDESDESSESSGDYSDESTTINKGEETTTKDVEDKTTTLNEGEETTTIDGEDESTTADNVEEPTTPSDSTEFSTITVTLPSSLQPPAGVFRCPQYNGNFRNPLDCGSFYICANNIPYLFTCQSGLVYNQAQDQCDYLKNVPECQ